MRWAEVHASCGPRLDDRSWSGVEAVARYVGDGHVGVVIAAGCLAVPVRESGLAVWRSSVSRGDRADIHGTMTLQNTEQKVEVGGIAVDLLRQGHGVGEVRVSARVESLEPTSRVEQGRLILLPFLEDDLE